MLRAVVFLWICLLCSVESKPNCRPIQASFCRSMSYTTSSSPSGVTGFSTRDIEQIIQTACSPDVATLFCRVVVPECGAEEDNRLKPCRRLCQRIYWPIRLRCDSLPQDNCVQSSQSRLQSPGPAACEPIGIPLCKDCPITSPSCPTYWDTHPKMTQAWRRTSSFPGKSAVQPFIKEFICSMYAPQCLEGKARAPCRRTCEHTRAGCEPLMRKFGFTWPDKFNCDNFKNDTCISVPLCSDLSYSQTMLPNSLGMSSQLQISQELGNFQPLVQFGCSPALKPFLCSVYTPECVQGESQPRAPAGHCVKRHAPPFGVSSSGGICQPITVPMCQGLSYTETFVPNLLGHSSQREAAVQMSFFNSIVQNFCSVDIRLFLCLVYAPKCVRGEVKRPCRSFCVRAKDGCRTAMDQLNMNWPRELQCDAFPTENCIPEHGDAEVTAKQILARLNTGGFTVLGNSLTLRTAFLLLTLADADHSDGLSSVEYFNMEHFVASVRTEYVELNQGRAPPAVTQSQLQMALFRRALISMDDRMFKPLWRLYRTGNSIDFDDFVALVTRLQVLKDRLSLVC
ncbi:hypothetical protein WMY93_013983 [Mugilogobius chulae]|uniref:FZ domain-containing protein n=1 Tax=Mugilogobius chulae TaxID=88201 RepID=A0AAW0NUA6_9GOBI